MKIYGKLSVAHKVNNKKAGYLYFSVLLLCVCVCVKKNVPKSNCYCCCCIAEENGTTWVINGINFEATFYCININKKQKMENEKKSRNTKIKGSCTN